MHHSLTIRALKFWMLLGTVLTGIFMTSHSLAVMVESLPAYSISPTLNGLNIAYFATQDRVKITLYLVNHEPFPVVCDAQYQGGPDNENAREQTVMTEKAIAFTFSYPKKTDDVFIQFICIKPRSETDTPDSAATSETNSPASAPANPVPIIETDLSVTRRAITH